MQIQIQTQIHSENMQSCKAPNLEYINALLLQVQVHSSTNAENYKDLYMVWFIRFVHLSICGRNAFIFIWCSSEGNCHKLQFFIAMVTRLESESSGKRIANDILYSKWQLDTLFVFVWHLVWKHIETLEFHFWCQSKIEGLSQKSIMCQNSPQLLAWFQIFNVDIIKPKYYH